MSKSTYYVDPARFTDYLLSYQYTGNEVIMDRLIRCFFFPLSRGVLRRFHFRQIDADDAIQMAVWQCVKQVERFTPDHPTKHGSSTNNPDRKAFSFFTTCTANTFRGMHRIEDTYHKGLKKLQQEEIRREMARSGGNQKLRELLDEDIFSVLRQDDDNISENDAMSYVNSHDGRDW
jgi:hypothetical protein